MPAVGPSDYSILSQFKNFDDYRRANEEFDAARRLQNLQALMLAAKANSLLDPNSPNTSLPASLQLANEYARAREAGDQQRMSDIAAFSKIYDKGVAPDLSGVFGQLPGYGNAVADIAGAKSGAEQTARKSVDLVFDPQIKDRESKATLENELKYKPKIEADIDASKKTADAASTNNITAIQTLPLIEKLTQYNQGTFDAPFSGGIVSDIARTIPKYQTKATNMDLLKQLRLDLAAPLAKQLGVNPTDKDFQASLDRIFDVNSSKASRQAQIDALGERIKLKQQVLSTPTKESSEKRSNTSATPSNPQRKIISFEDLR